MLCSHCRADQFDQARSSNRIQCTSLARSVWVIGSGREVLSWSALLGLPTRISFSCHVTHVVFTPFSRAWSGWIGKFWGSRWSSWSDRQWEPTLRTAVCQSWSRKFGHITCLVFWSCNVFYGHDFSDYAGQLSVTITITCIPFLLRWS